MIIKPMNKKVIKKLTGIFNIFRHASYIPTGRLDGKVAVVTASTDGIGYGIAERLAKEGAKVVISSRKQKNVDQALEKLKSHKLDVCGLVCHVGNPEDRKRLYSEAINQYGRINILVSNAAVNPAIGGVLECEESSWDKIFDVNVKSSFMLAKEVVPHLEKQGSGKIVFISSIAGFQPFPVRTEYTSHTEVKALTDLFLFERQMLANVKHSIPRMTDSKSLGAYSVSKTTVVALTKTAALQLANKNITVNCIAPGIVKTKFAQALTANEELEKEALSLIPMGRFGKPEDIAGAVAFLVSEDADYITGETIVVAGGSASRL